MKHAFSTTLSLLLLASFAFGQNATPTIRVELADTIAEVNGERITRNALANESLHLHGANELQNIISRTLILRECERQRITITAEEINEEILRRAQTFKLTSEEFLKTFEDRLGISPEQHRQDIILVNLALARLAGPRLSISEEELQVEYEKNFGAAVQVRKIVLGSKADAEAVLAEVKQHPETFASIAKNRSIDPVSQSFGGMLHPIRRHTYNPVVEQMLFALQPGDISQIVEFPPGCFSIYRCEGHLQPHDVDYAAVKRQLFYQIWDAKLPQVSNEILLELQRQTQVQVVFGNPALQGQFPGVAAVLTGPGQNAPNNPNVQYISMAELAEACIRKHGQGVLNDMISRLIVEQACRREGIVITDQDIDREIHEMAFKYLPLLPDGSANVDLWLRRATEESDLSLPMYRKNVVAPVLSLKRLTRQHVNVTEDDIQRSFEANYGQRIQCLAIFFNATDQRRAMEVWQMANRHRTEEAFADLAERYSFDPSSRQGKGVIPPIARHTGHPELEAAAFSLQPGELSQIIQIDDSFVILFCVRHIESLPVQIEDVRGDLIADIFEKKQQHIISLYFERLFEQSVWANHLTGESGDPMAERALQGSETPLLR
ncbi:MAG: peptidylprolyl isomerase [Planctomycetaceae bacterium]|nr:peptidylprolyl isomerase [Planctomycetaceae bacterium]